MTTQPLYMLNSFIIILESSSKLSEVANTLTYSAYWNDSSQLKQDFSALKTSWKIKEGEKTLK